MIPIAETEHAAALRIAGIVMPIVERAPSAVIYPATETNRVRAVKRTAAHARHRPQNAAMEAAMEVKPAAIVRWIAACAPGAVMARVTVVSPAATAPETAACASSAAMEASEVLNRATMQTS